MRPALHLLPLYVSCDYAKGTPPVMFVYANETPLVFLSMYLVLEIENIFISLSFRLTSHATFDKSRHKNSSERARAQNTD